MKKFLSVLLALCMGLALFAACGDDSSGPITSVPETNINPLTGYEKGPDYPQGLRPTAVMVGNRPEDFPQSGITSAAIIYEMLTEGGVPRMMAIYEDYREMPLVGPVRSTRDQFLHFAMPINSMVAHIGTSRYAKDLLNYHTYQTVDGIYLGAAAFYYDTERAKSKNSEFCWYTNWEMFGFGITELGLNTEGEYLPVFNFAPANAAKVTPTGGRATDISFSFSDYAEATFQYNYETGLYYKTAYGAPQMDAANNTQLAFQNVFILGTTIIPKPDGFCADFNFDSGVGYYFSNGAWQKVNWRKGDVFDQLVITADGREIEVNCGTSYVAFLPNDRLTQIVIEATEMPTTGNNSTSTDDSALAQSNSAP
ncbi:DUF3048 domain-containing protein [Ruminococcaceae bacterium OttesenSCG-928-N02]|nr:DUF3048 domain-containing protein [Ruminococcaceae bacterium OttesenSCG-928-N02]